ncbi:MAG: 4'-phosphopantetheinyl transferase superfamily protein [Bacteroidota bacterium]
MPRHGAFDLDALPVDELARVETFGSAERRRQFVLGRLAVRRLVAAQHDVPEAKVPIELGSDGAPTVRGGFVSIAHGGTGFDAIGMAAFAHQPVGVDVEIIRERHPRLADRILRPDEAHLKAVLRMEQTSGVPLVWSLKEAVLKGQRTGLRAGARSVRIAEIDIASSRARAESDVSGPWRLTYERRGDLWLTVALAEAQAPT